MWSLRRKRTGISPRSDLRMGATNQLFVAPSRYFSTSKNDRWCDSCLSKIAHQWRLKTEGAVQQPGQITSTPRVECCSAVTALDGRECISAQEYSTSCPHSRQTRYVRFWIVNTPLSW